MVRFMKIAAMAGGTLVLSALPVFAQDLNPLGLDLDPFHLFTPAPPPPPAPPPAAPVVVVHHHHHWHHGHHHGHPDHKAK